MKKRLSTIVVGTFVCFALLLSGCGKRAPEAAPTMNAVTDTTGQTSTYNDLSWDSLTQEDLNILSLKVAAGEATPEEEALYQVALEKKENGWVPYSDTTTTNTESNDSTDSEEATSGYDPSIGPVIANVTWNYDTGSYLCDLYQYDINTGDMNYVFFTSNKKVSTSVNPNGNLDMDMKSTTGSNWYTRGIGWRYGQIFSKDFKKAAVEFTDKSSGHHVGWVDSNENITDISDILHPSTNEFTSRVPKDYGAVFTPSGDFAFVDRNRNKVVFVNPDTLEVIGEQDTTSEDEDIFYSSNGERVNITISDDRRSPLDSFLDYCIGETSNEVYGISNGGFTTYGVVYRVYLGETGGTYTQITPDSDYKVEQCAYYDGKLAFIARRGENSSLFVLNDVNDMNSVRKVCDLPNFSDSSYPRMHTYGAMFWR